VLRIGRGRLVASIGCDTTDCKKEELVSAWIAYLQIADKQAPTPFEGGDWSWWDNDTVRNNPKLSTAAKKLKDAAAQYWLADVEISVVESFRRMVLIQKEIRKVDRKEQELVDAWIAYLKIAMSVDQAPTTPFKGGDWSWWDNDTVRNNPQLLTAAQKLIDAARQYWPADVEISAVESFGRMPYIRKAIREDEKEAKKKALWASYRRG
jgi:poly(3-hydroxybutyrate) depolymerase